MRTSKKIGVGSVPRRSRHDKQSKEQLIYIVKTKVIKLHVKRLCNSMDLTLASQVINSVFQPTQLSLINVVYFFLFALGSICLRIQQFHNSQVGLYIFYCFYQNRSDMNCFLQRHNISLPYLIMTNQFFHASIWYVSL